MGGILSVFFYLWTRRTHTKATESSNVSYLTAEWKHQRGTEVKLSLINLKPLAFRTKKKLDWLIFLSFWILSYARIECVNRGVFLVSWQPQSQSAKLFTSMGDLTKCVQWQEGGNTLLELLESADRIQWVNTNLWMQAPKRRIPLFMASESKMNSFYEADFDSVMAPTQSRQQRVAVKGELWHDGGTKKESTCTWLNADRSPAQLFLMVMHWQEGRLFLIACTSFRHTKQTFHPPPPTPLSLSFVSNLHWPAFKAVSGSLAQKTLEESGCLQLDDQSRAWNPLAGLSQISW